MTDHGLAEVAVYGRVAEIQGGAGVVGCDRVYTYSIHDEHMMGIKLTCNCMYNIYITNICIYIHTYL